MKDGRRWVEGDFSKKVKGRADPFFFSSSWEGLPRGGLHEMTSFFARGLPLFFSTVPFYSFSFPAFFIYFPFPRFFLPFSFSLFSPLHSSLQRVCSGGSLETSKPREALEDRERERRRNRSNSEREREKNDQANQIKRSRPLAAAAMTTTQPEAVAGRERRRGRTKKKGT